MILYAAAGATGLAIGHVAFPRFLRAFIKHQYVRMLEEDERERRRGLRGFDDEPLDMDPKDVPPPAFEVGGDPVEPLEKRPPFGPGGTEKAVRRLQESRKYRHHPRPRGTDVFPDPGPGEPQHMFAGDQMRADVEFYKQKFRHAQEMLEALRMPEAVIAPEVEVVEIHEFGSKDPIAYVRVEDGALVEQMVCPDCYMGYDYKIVAKHYEPGSVPDQIPEDAPKCKHCNGRGIISVTRF